MERAIDDRRVHARVSGAAVRAISALVRPGRSVLVLDLSATGALVAALRPLRPGASVHVHFEAAGERSTVAAIVARCLVAAMDAERMVYHAALSFEYPCEWVRERQARFGSPFLGTATSVRPASVNAIPDEFDPSPIEIAAEGKWFDIPHLA
jgi:hypothetical protein